MKLLLDTHVFLWWDSAPGKLPVNFRAACENPENMLFLSIASLWEIQIKTQLGKLTLRRPLMELIQEQQADNELLLLPVQAEHVYVLQTLPPHHKDPFDRILITQAQTESLLLLTVDAAFAAYSVQCLSPQNI